MDKPRACSYQKNGRTITLDRSKSPQKVSGVEFRAITLRQLRAIMANIIRRCLAEKWVSYKGKEIDDPTKANLYEANTYVILPYTVHSGKSLVERLPSTAGPQPPQFFVSHWWGQPVQDFVNCIEQLVRDFGRNNCSQDDKRGGGMSIDTPIWVCAYANNQWDLSDVVADPRESGFVRAMDVAKRRTVTILDDQGVVFTRIWCVLETYFTLIDPQQEEDSKDSEKGLLAIYTSKRHNYKLGSTKQEREAVGIIAGGSTSDRNHAPNTTAREEKFPYELIKKALTIQFEDAEASVNDDRIHCLNTIIGKSIADIDDPPPKSHQKYVELNDALRSIFAASQAALQGAAKEGHEIAMLRALSKGTNKVTMEFDFGSEGGFSELTATRATQLISYLPLTMKQLRIANAEFGDEFMEALIQRVREFKNLEFLEISDTLMGWGREKEGQEAGVRLAEVLSTNTTINNLELSRTDLIGVDNVEQWGDALMENKTLTDWDLDGVDAEIKEQLRTKTKDRTPSLEIK